MTNEEKLFVTVKSDISNCICKIVNANKSRISDNFLNNLANKHTDFIIADIERIILSVTVVNLNDL